jgi:hypothetical protein
MKYRHTWTHSSLAAALFILGTTCSIPLARAGDDGEGCDRRSCDSRGAAYRGSWDSRDDWSRRADDRGYRDRGGCRGDHQRSARWQRDRGGSRSSRWGRSSRNADWGGQRCDSRRGGSGYGGRVSGYSARSSYYDPYCGSTFTSLDGYQGHCRQHHHAATIQVVAVAGGGGGSCGR